MLNERRKPARRVRSSENNIVTKGRTGTTATDTQDPRLVGPKGKRKRSAEEILKNYSAGPVGKLRNHTVYHDMGYLMAESLGLVSEADDTRARDAGRSDLVNRPKKTPKSDSSYNSEKELKKDLATRRSSGRGFIGKGDTADNTIIVEPGTPLTPELKKARSTFRLKQKGERARAAGKPLPKVIRRRKR